MNQKSVSERLLETLKEISTSEVNEISLLIAIIKKNIINLINRNMQEISDEFFEKCEYYGKSISEVNSEKIEILNSYKEEFNRIARKFEEEYINIALEVQEAQANQKTTIVDMKKTIDLKEKYMKSEEYQTDNTNSQLMIESYNKKIDMMAEKYIKYCGLEEACIVKLKECNEKIESAINSVMQYETGKQMAIAEKKNIIIFFSKILNLFSREKRFQKEYINKKKQNIEKIRISTDGVLNDLDKKLNDSLIILHAYNSKISQILN